MEYHSDLIQILNSSDYWGPTKSRYYEKFCQLRAENEPNKAAIDLLNNLSDIMHESQDGVEEIIQAGIMSGRIRDANQTRVSVAGKNYERLVTFSLEVNRILRNIPRDLIIKPVTKRSPFISEYATINVGAETQKPDADVALYKQEDDSPIIICSTKTSLRERAGQSYKWKLLLDISRCNCEHDDECPLNRYDIEYPAEREIHFFFITADFYNEIHQPQQRGMFQFFDGAFVSKAIEPVEYIKRLSEIIPKINEIF